MTVLPDITDNDKEGSTNTTSDLEQSTLAESTLPEFTLLQTLNALEEEASNTDKGLHNFFDNDDNNLIIYIAPCHKSYILSAL